MKDQLVRSQFTTRYVIQDKIGEGAMGAVYRATDRLTGDTVALKRVAVSSNLLDFASRASLGDSGNVRLALAQEFRTLSSLRHPHIISVLDYGFDTVRQPYFTMDLLTGAQTLLEAGDNQPIETQVNLLIQVLQALTYLHRRGILHRDLKPANVLVNEHMQARVLDFGLSTAIEHASGTAGTLAYMAPEVIQGQSVSQASDIYSVGMMAYQLFVGSYPFNSRNPTRLMAHIVTLEPDVSSINNPELATVVTRLLAKDPINRYSNADDAIRDLCAAVEQAPLQESPTIRESFLQAAPFIGRETELAQLTHALHNAIKGQGSSWLVGGESGVGKSRLLDELRIQALVEGAIVLRGQAIEGGGLPYQLWHDVLPHLVLSTEVTDLEARILKEIVPNIDNLLNRTISDVPELDTKAYLQRLPAIINAIFQRQKTPIVLILEDLQWAMESVEIFRELHRIDAELPLLIIGSYRDDERPNLPEEVSGVQVIYLERFSEDAINQLSTAMLGESGKQSHIINLLNKETEGNVFFLVEVVRALAEEAGSLSKVGQTPLPIQVFTEGIQQIIKRRLNKIPYTMQPLLTFAAVSGREIDQQLLTHRFASTLVDDWLIACADAAIMDIQDNRWRFAHDKLRETVLTDLDDDERISLHRAVAESLETLYPNDTRYNDILLGHWSHAGVIEKELAYLIPVTEETANIASNYERVHQLVQRGLTLMEEDDVRRLPLLNIQVTAYINQGDFAQAEVISMQVYNLAKQIDDQREMANSLNALGVMASMRGDLVTGRHYFEESLQHRTQLNDKRGMGLSLMNLGINAKNSNDHSKSKSYYQQAVALFQEVEDINNLASVYQNLGSLCILQHQYDEATKHLKNALNIAEKHNNKRVQAQALSTLANVELALNNFDEAEQCIQRSLTIYQQIEDTVGILNCKKELGLIYSFQNDERARQFLIESLEQVYQLEMIPTLLEMIIGFINLYIEQHETGKAKALLQFISNHPNRRPEVDVLVHHITSRLEPYRAETPLDLDLQLNVDDIIKVLLKDFQ